MLFTKKKTLKGNLVVDLYNGFVTVHFVPTEKTDKSKEVYSGSYEFPYLKVADPKRQLTDEAIEIAFAKLKKALFDAMSDDKLTAEILHIFVIPHGTLSQAQISNLHVKLRKKEKLNTAILREILEKHHLDQMAFKNLIESDAGKRYFKSKKVVTAVLPNYYDLKSWKDKPAVYLELMIAETLLIETLHNKYEKLLKAEFPEARLISFINPGVLYSLRESINTTDLRSDKYNVVDIGKEFITLYKIYRKRVIHTQTIQFGANSLLRDIDPFFGGFELAKSGLLNYLSGKCKGDLCSRIKDAMDKFEKEISSVLAQKDTKDKQTLAEQIVFAKTKFIFNDAIEAEIFTFIASVIKKALKDKSDEQFDKTKHRLDYHEIISKIFSKDFAVEDNKDEIIVL